MDLFSVENLFSVDENKFEDIGRKTKEFDSELPPWCLVHPFSNIGLAGWLATISQANRPGPFTQGAEAYGFSSKAEPTKWWC